MQADRKGADGATTADLARAGTAALPDLQVRSKVASALLALCSAMAVLALALAAGRSLAAWSPLAHLLAVSIVKAFSLFGAIVLLVFIGRRRAGKRRHCDRPPLGGEAPR